MSGSEDGVLIRSEGDVLLGAIRISDEGANNDELCLLKGIISARLAADTGA